MSDNVIPMNGRVKREIGQNPETLVVKVAFGTGSHLGRIRTVQTRWVDLCEKMATPKRDNITVAEFAALSKDEQHERKKGRFFVGGSYPENKRKAKQMVERTLITMDLDNLTPGLLADLEMGFTWLSDYEYAVYSTRQHMPERPRVRVVVPLSVPISAELLGPVTRLIAYQLDKRMEAVDPVSFRSNQVMYMPKISSDSSFVYYRNHGKLLHAHDHVLPLVDDWTDYSKLPRSAREMPRDNLGKTPQDPRLKHGLVGAVCRAYTISEAIEEFLPDIYGNFETDSSGAMRGSYLLGTSRNGVLIYDQDTHLYSNQSSDPCSQVLMNAFDMLRRHRFSERDPDPEPGKPLPDPKTLPSYEAMRGFFEKNERVRKELLEDMHDLESTIDDIFPPDEDEAPVVDAFRKPVEAPPEVNSDPISDDWFHSLQKTEKGANRPTLGNIIAILENDPRFAGRFKFNEFLHAPVLVKRLESRRLNKRTSPLQNPDTGDILTAEPNTFIRLVLESPSGTDRAGYGMSNVTPHNVEAAIQFVVRANPFHPVQDFIRSCRWDGKPRLARMFETYCKLSHNAYHARVAECLMVGAVMRVFEPGSKFDYVVILQGPQGVGKSTMIRYLAGSDNRFVELTGKLEDRKFLVEQLQGKTFAEIPELVQFHREQTQVLKGVFSSVSDRVRLAYDKSAENYRRQNVFMGTTNEELIFKDRTGNRRYWPIMLTGPISLKQLREDVPQLYAEAYQIYLHMRRQHPNLAEPLPLTLSGSAEVEHRRMLGERMIDTPDDELAHDIEAWLDALVPTNRAMPGWRRTSESVESDDFDPDLEDMQPRQIASIRDINYFVRHLTDESRISAQDIARTIAAMKLVPGWNHKSEVKKINGKAVRVYRRVPK